MTLAFEKHESHPMVDALLRGRVARWQELNRAVDERDDMLDFAVKLFEHDRDRAVTNYFQNGIEQRNLLRHVAAWRGPVRRMLDFASGYGRLTRFLVHEGFADEITVSDILEGGMEFQARQFGVRTIVSTTLPGNFTAPDRYDLIFVASLFTHLPPATFTPWLRKLAGLLEPAGLLIFSVHDQSLAPQPVEGIHFASNSESRVLDTEDYGSTWVSEAYVREQVAAIDPSFDCIRMPRALGDWQDVYVVSPSKIANPTPRRTMKAFLERFELTAEGARLSGWTTDLVEQADRVEVRIGEEVVATTRDFHPRSDVAAWLGVPESLGVGWELLIPQDRIRSFRYEVVTISAFSASGVECILFLGTIDSLSGHVGRERAKEFERQLVVKANEMAGLQRDLEVLDVQRRALEAEIAAMKQSRFWRARERWFAFKRAVGV